MKVLGLARSFHFEDYQPSRIIDGQTARVVLVHTFQQMRTCWVSLSGGFLHQELIEIFWLRFQHFLTQVLHLPSNPE